MNIPTVLLWLEAGKYLPWISLQQVNHIWLKLWPYPQSWRREQTQSLLIKPIFELLPWKEMDGWIYEWPYYHTNNNKPTQPQWIPESWSRYHQHDEHKWNSDMVKWCYIRNHGCNDRGSDTEPCLPSFLSETSI